MNYVRIVCEGEKTEPNYFQGIIKAYGWKGALIVKSKDNSPMGVVQKARDEYRKAVRAKIPKDRIHVWAVFDRDGHANLKNAIQMAMDNNINIAFSSVCFEYFVLLHFERCTRPFTNCDEVISYLQENHNKDYSKKGNHFTDLKEHFQVAIDNNEWLLARYRDGGGEEGTAIADANPYTDVYRLLIFLTYPTPWPT